MEIKKNSYYFQHDYSASTDSRIIKVRIKHGWAGYGVYWAILEALAREGGYMDREAIGIAIGDTNCLQILDDCIESGLLKNGKGGVYSQRLCDHLQIRESLKKFGEIGAKKRWGDTSSKNSHPIAPPNENPNAKERKGKERKDNISKADSSFTGNLFGTEIKKPVSTTRWQQMALDYSKKFGFEPTASWFKFFKNGSEAKLQDTYAKMFGLSPSDPEKYFYKLYGGNYAPDTTK